MEVRKDILFGIEAGEQQVDLLIRNGDFVIGESDQQHCLHILEALPGQYRQWPAIGVGVRKMLNGNVTGTEKRVVHVQLQLDGYKPKDVRFDGETLQVRL